MPDFPVEITPEALREIKRLIERKGEAGSFLRIGVKGGGCSGLEYVIKIETRERDYDLVWHEDGAKVVCDAKSAIYLRGARMVWTGNLIGGGFSFDNPNAQRSCGCGSSFIPAERS